jgi:hypothetical protein
MLDRLNAQVKLIEFVVTVSETVPVNPFVGATVIVEVPAAPVSTVTVVGLAVMVKLGTLVTW